jgi:hypothetical protein
MLEQMERAAEGHSPSGLGAPLAPLPAERSEPILAPVRQLRDHLRAAAARMAPAELAEFEQLQSLNNTFVWLSNLLARIRMAVDDIRPSNMGKYGTVEEEERDALVSLHRELMEKIQVSRKAADAELGS